jgi:hypothetical protein
MLEGWRASYYLEAFRIIGSREGRKARKRRKGRNGRKPKL